MITILSNCLNKDEIQEILSLSEVIINKEKLSNCNTISFSTQLDQRLKNKLSQSFGIDLSVVNSIPMRWIKGDTNAHIDSGVNSFEKTHLIYLTDSPGQFIIDNNTYPIIAGQGFIFSEGLRHETIGTGNDPRLLIGPISEQGFMVGLAGITADGADTTVYLRYNPDTATNEIKYNDSDWYTFYFPTTVNNINPDPANNVLKIIFTTGISITTINDYFICDSDGIQFGSTSLNEDGLRPIITINVTGTYDGLIRNGDSSTNGKNNIYIYNLDIEANGSTQATRAGWLCQQYFGNHAINNYIVNCSSSGDISGGGGAGGIVGSYGGSGTGAELNIIGCSSYGSISQLNGGIIGANAGDGGGSVTCEECWVEGEIQGFGGGIFGEKAGINGYALANKCYSKGNIGINGGGIFSRYAGANGGAAYATNCYSEGNIAGDAGGIFGLGAGTDGVNPQGITQATNCYSKGTITTSGTGIYGTGKVNSTTTNCYAANGSWSNSAANLQLQNLPISPNTIGTTWVYKGINTSYELNDMGFTPYTINLINPTTSRPIRNFSQTILPGQNTISAIQPDASGNIFVILQKDGDNQDSYDSITINSQTGVITTTSSTKPGTYTLHIRSTGSYSITTFTLIVNQTPSPPSTELLWSQRTLYLKGMDYRTINETVAGNVLVENFNNRRGTISYMDIINMKKANVSKGFL